MNFRQTFFSVLFLSFLTCGIGFSTVRAQSLIAQAESVSGDAFKIVTRTPSGAKIYAVTKPNSKILAAIDQGLNDLFAVAKKNKYKSHLNYADYTIFIAKADRKKDSAGNYSPDFAIGAAQYTGSVYDKGGFIYAAGMVISNNPCAFLIAEHDKNLERVSEVVRYEGEHLVLYHNDRKKYNETADHSKGGGHPILN